MAVDRSSKKASRPPSRSRARAATTGGETDRRDQGSGGRSADSRAARREETRRALLDAASRLFAQNGFHETSVPDIVQAAGVGHGTFYEYFGSRRDILLALTEQAVVKGQRMPRLHSPHLADRIRAEIVWYLSDYVEHLELSKVWHEASNFDPDIAAERRRARSHRLRRVRKGIEAAGGGPPGIDPTVAAAALTAMLEEFAHRWFIEGDGPGTSANDVVAAAETLATLWLTAIQVDGARS